MESIELKEKVTCEMEIFFNQNGGSAEEILIWEAFKAYIQGLLRAYMDKTHKEVRSQLIFPTGKLEEEVKIASTVENINLLQHIAT